MRILLASPTDVVNYREAAIRVAERLNQENQAKLGTAQFLEVVDWNRQIAELQGLPESAILEEISVREDDVFLGVAWLAFDRQIGDDNNGYHYSTERNFELAFAYWKAQRPEHCFLCRCMRLPEKLTDINGRALDRVHQFFSRFSIDGGNPVAYYEFDSATDLEEYLATRLGRLFQGLGAPPRPGTGGEAPTVVAGPQGRPSSPPSSPPPSSPPPSSPPVAGPQGTPSPSPTPQSPAAGVTVDRDTKAPGARAVPTPVAETVPPSASPASVSAPPTGPEFERKMQPGKAYEVSFLSIEIVLEEPLQQAAKSRPAEVAALFKSFRELVSGIAANYGGEVFRWQDNGGMMIFWSSRSFDHAIMTGLKVLHNLPVFNLDPEQNPFALSIKTRAAAHDAVIIFQLPSRDITSSDIDFVINLQQQHTDATELSITRRLLERIDERLKPHFRFKSRYDNEPVYACRLPSTDQGPSSESLRDFTDRLSQQTTVVRAVLATPSAQLDEGALDGMSTAVDEVYTILNKFCTSHSNIDNTWAAELFQELGDAATTLTQEEAAIWQDLRKSYVGGTYSASKARKLEAIVKAASRRRARPVVILDKLIQRCTLLAGGEEEVQPSTEAADGDLIKKLEAFIKADVLDVETALTELLLHHKPLMLEFLQRPRPDDDLHRRLLDKLWETADLTLLDDLFSIRGRQRAGEEKVFEVLESKVKDRRFSVIRSLLNSDEQPSQERLQKYFAQAGLSPEAADLQVVWRSLVLGHRNAEVRKYSAFRLSPHSMWQAISHPSIPILSILAIGERINRAEGDDAKKIFFDCTRSRLETAIDGARSHEEFSIISKLVLLLIDFPFLVETGYFERFDDLLQKLLEQCQKVGFQVEYFENLRRTLEEARRSSGETGPSKPPAGIQKLPLTIQRRLAGEARYVYWFVSHPDPRIAGETLRHVGLMNIERVLRLREVNSAVMQAILRKPELFTRSQALIAALNHPKCTQDFANRHLPHLGRSRQGSVALQKVVNNPSANPVVRAAAKRALVGSPPRRAAR